MDLEHPRLSSTHSKTCEEKEVESVQMDEETFDHNIEDKKTKIFLETTDDHSSSNDSICESGSSIDSERQINVINQGENAKSNYSDTHINSTKSISSSSRRSSSPSSLESPLDDLFRINEEFKYTNSNESIQASKSEKDNVSNDESFGKSKVDNHLLVQTSTNQVYNLSHNQKSLSLTASPPTQVMDRSGRYDVSRVPSSIFEANTNPLEWSIGSNDSLFSIQLGQPSFSREKALICGELSLLEDLTKLSGSNNKISSVIEEEIETTLKNVVENLQATKTSQGSLKLEGEGIDEANDEIETLDETKSFKSSKFIISCLSNNIGTGMSTSDFPIKKRSRRLWHCYNCSRVFCHLSLSNNCCGTFSCCWNTNHTKHRHHTSSILKEEETNDSVKMDLPQQQSSKQEFEVTSNLSTNCCNWFKCFSCSCSFCKFSCTSCQCC